MKRLIDIVEDVKSNKRPDYEELRYAVLALSALNTFEHMAISKLIEFIKTVLMVDDNGDKIEDEIKN